MTIQIKDMTASNEIDMSEMGAVRGGSKITVDEFTYYANSKLLNNPYEVISMASQVDVNPDPDPDNESIGI
jgi:hypothetical protein